MTDNNEIDLRRFFRVIRRHKVLFSSVFVVIAGLSVLYALSRAPEYTTEATVLIEDESSDMPQRAGGAMGMMMRTFSIGGFGSAKVDNELLLVDSHDVLIRTVKRLKLNVSANERTGLRSLTLWDDSPVRLVVPSALGDTLLPKDAFRVSVRLHDGKADIKVFRGRIFKTVYAEEKNVTLPATIDTRFGQLSVVTTDKYSATADATVKFSVNSYEMVADQLSRRLLIDSSDKVSDGIGLELSSSCPARDRAILDALLDEYNSKRVERKHKLARTEVDFLNERINQIFADISESEKKIEQFKTESHFVSIENEAPILLETSLSAHEELLNARAQLIYCEQVLKSLEDNPGALLPAYSTPGGGDSDGNPMVTTYNEQLMLLAELRRSAKPGNHALHVAEERIVDMRNAVITSISQTLESARRIINERTGIVGQMDAQLGRLPKYEREYVKLSRDNLIQNELYVLLVEKRESALLRLNSESSLGFVIDPAHTNIRSSMIKSIMIAGIGILFALGLCIGLGIWIMRREDTVDAPMDVRKFGLEPHAMMLRYDNAGDANRVRAAITSAPSPENIVLAGLTTGCGSAVEAIVNSFRRAQLKVDMINDLSSNDVMLSASYASRLSTAVKSGEYVMTVVPDGKSVGEVVTVLARENAITVLFVVAGMLKRGSFGNIISGIDRERIFVVVIDDEAVS